MDLVPKVKKRPNPHRCHSQRHHLHKSHNCLERLKTSCKVDDSYDAWSKHSFINSTLVGVAWCQDIQRRNGVWELADSWQKKQKNKTSVLLAFGTCAVHITKEKDDDHVRNEQTSDNLGKLQVFQEAKYLK